MKKREERLERLNLVLRTIRNVNQLLVKEKDRTKLLQGVCNNLVENRGYYNAWIAIIERSGAEMTIFEAGFDNKSSPFVEPLKMNNLTDCAQRALSQTGVVVTNDPESVCTDCPLSSSYAGRGAMSIRLEHAGKVYGMLNASIPKSFVSDEEEQSLFEEIAGDIAFALHNIELRKEHSLADEALLKTTNTLNERVKELNCLYGISSLIEKRGISLEEILQGTVQLIPPAWRYPESTCARIVFEDNEFKTSNYKETNLAQFSDIIVHGETKGTLKICCMEKWPEMDAGIFLKEERDLLHAIAERMGKFIERKRSEAALLKSEKRFRDLIQNSLTGISIIQDNQIVYQNTAQRNLTGALPESFQPLNVENTYPDDIKKVKQFFDDQMAGVDREQGIDFRFFPPAKKGSRIDMKWVSCRASLIEYQGKEAILVNMMDITRTRELEELLRMQDKMSSLGRVSAGIAHEIRNPLSGINIYLNTLEKIYNKNEGMEKIQGILGQLQSASNKIETVIRRVMDFSKPGEPTFVLTDLNQPIKEAINLSSATFRKRGIKIEKYLADDLPLCYADPHLIEQLVLNLITNAIEAMKNIDQDKKIEITSSVKNGRIVVTVSDSGPGVPFNRKEKIFDPFYSTKNGGTGIGLSIVRRIVTDHGGSLDVFPGKWGGAEFMIEIPAEKGPDQA